MPSNEPSTLIVHLAFKCFRVPRASGSILDVYLGDKLLCSSRKPVIDAARKLLAKKLADPEDYLAVRWGSTPIDIVRKTVGDAASLPA
jgi:hypothetical protein